MNVSEAVSEPLNELHFPMEALGDAVVFGEAPPFHATRRERVRLWQKIIVVFMRLKIVAGVFWGWEVQSALNEEIG